MSNSTEAKECTAVGGGSGKLIFSHLKKAKLIKINIGITVLYTENVCTLLDSHL